MFFDFGGSAANIFTKQFRSTRLFKLCFPPTIDLSKFGPKNAWDRLAFDNFLWEQGKCCPFCSFWGAGGLFNIFFRFGVRQGKMLPVFLENFLTFVFTKFSMFSCGEFSINIWLYTFCVTDMGKCCLISRKALTRFMLMRLPRKFAFKCWLYKFYVEKNKGSCCPFFLDKKKSFSWHSTLQMLRHKQGEMLPVFLETFWTFDFTRSASQTSGNAAWLALKVFRPSTSQIICCRQREIAACFSRYYFLGIRLNRFYVSNWRKCRSENNAAFDFKNLVLQTKGECCLVFSHSLINIYFTNFLFEMGKCCSCFLVPFWFYNFRVRNRGKCCPFFAKNISLTSQLLCYKRGNAAPFS